MAERVGFEPTLRYKRRPLFESGTISLSDTSPEANLRVFYDSKKHFANNLLMDCFISSFIIPIAHSFVKTLRCCHLKPWGNVAVSVQGYCYCRVTKPFLNYFRVDALLKHKAGVGMSGIASLTLCWCGRWIALVGKVLWQF